MGLSLIAFVVGGELEARRIRSLPRGAVGIASAQAILCMAAVLGATAIAGKPLALGLALGAIAAATAPSTTIMIIRRHKADGPLTRMLLSVVAVDDAVCIMLYAVAVSVARALPVAGASQSVLGVAGVFLWELAGSVMVGVVIGIALGYFVKYARGGDELVVIVVGAVLLASGLGSRMHVSPIISCLVLGATLTNLVTGNRKLFATIDRFSPPVYVLLFALAEWVATSGRSLPRSHSSSCMSPRGWPARWWGRSWQRSRPEPARQRVYVSVCRYCPRRAWLRGSPSQPELPCRITVPCSHQLWCLGFSSLKR